VAENLNDRPRAIRAAQPAQVVGINLIDDGADQGWEASERGAMQCAVFKSHFVRSAPTAHPPPYVARAESAPENFFDMRWRPSINRHLE